jgi:GntR family transcriptional repressor for pyruvate dehydrogenase complex
MPTADRVREVVAHLEQRILSGQLAPGDKVPPERELSAALGVSRSVVREAIGRLASMGLVHSVHGSGTRVEAPNGRPITAGYQRLLRQGEFDLAHLAEVRLPLESAIAALAAKHRTDDHLARLAAAQKALANARAGLDAHVRADLDFHAVLAEASGNPLFGIVLAPIQELLIESRRRTLGRHGSALAHRHHAAILAAVEVGDAEAAALAMRAHLEANFQHLHDDEHA